MALPLPPQFISFDLCRYSSLPPTLATIPSITQPVPVPICSFPDFWCLYFIT